MADNHGAPDSKSQSDKFRELARELECDESPEAFKAAVKKIATAPKAPVKKP